MQTGSYEGRQNHIPELSTPAIEVFENIYAGADYLVQFEIPEFTAICPKTGLPDFGVIYIDYKPNRWCIELKSLKEYFFFFRDIGIFHENVVNKVTEDLIRAAAPNYLKVRGDYNVRGGVKTVVQREYTVK